MSLKSSLTFYNLARGNKEERGREREGRTQRIGGSEFSGRPRSCSQ